MGRKYFFTFFSVKAGRKRFFLALYILAVLVIGSWSYGREITQLWQPVGQGISRMVWEEVFALTEWSEDSLGDIFAASIPLWRAGNQPAGNNGVVADHPPKFGFLKRILGIQLGQPDTYLNAALPLFALVPLPPDPLDLIVRNEQQLQGEAGDVQQGTEVPEQPGSNTLGTLGPGPAVFIYNTHTGETYAQTDGVVKLQGKLGGVYQAGRALATALEEKHNLKVLQSDKIHDANWLKDNPYTLSSVTLKEALAANPSVQVVIDVHRDAQVPRESSLTTIKGMKVARIMLVVGTNARNNHPDWMKNYLFAQQVGKQMEKMYPGLLRKVITKRGRYNQNLHPQAILVEIGSTENSTEEAKKSAELFADVIASMIKNE